MKFYSQHGQDKYLYNEFFRGKDSGVFVEIGADDGVTLSNTYVFERLGWTGLCIEPHRASFRKLKKKRRCICENCAVYDQNGKSKFLEISGTGLRHWSGIVESFEEDRKKQMKTNKVFRRSRREKVKVRTRTLDYLLEKYGLFQVDYLSIDAEGADFRILCSIDFDRFWIGAISIENNSQTSDIEEYMLSKGYRLVKRLEVDEIYVKSDAKFVSDTP